MRLQTIAVRNYSEDGQYFSDVLRFRRWGSDGKPRGFELMLSPRAYADLPPGERCLPMTADDVREWLNECPDQVITIEDMN